MLERQLLKFLELADANYTSGSGSITITLRIAFVDTVAVSMAVMMDMIMLMYWTTFVVIPWQEGIYKAVLLLCIPILDCLPPTHDTLAIAKVINYLATAIGIGLLAATMRTDELLPKTRKRQIVGYRAEPSVHLGRIGN